MKLRQGEIRAKVRAYHLCELASMHQVFDVVFLVTKAYDTRWHAELIKPYLKPDGFLIGLQNAMTAGVIADVVGHSRTLGCVPELSSYCFVPGEIKRNTAPRPHLVWARQLSSIHRQAASRRWPRSCATPARWRFRRTSSPRNT